MAIELLNIIMVRNKYDFFTAPTRLITGNEKATLRAALDVIHNGMILIVNCFRLHHKSTIEMKGIQVS
jgi:hypothetical protein